MSPSHCGWPRNRKPKTANASARMGKIDRKPKYVTPAASKLPRVSPQRFHARQAGVCWMRAHHRLRVCTSASAVEVERAHLAPDLFGTVLVEVELAHREGALEVSEVLEGPVEAVLGHVVRHGHVGVVVEVDVPGQRAAAYGALEHLALGDFVC